jgi:phosphoenolpyruvate synthase/pyruvate phosphate dikinase
MCAGLRRCSTRCNSAGHHCGALEPPSIGGDSALTKDLAMAVVVQILVPADVAGVLFTANPISGRRDEMVVNASFGLGEAVVSGQVTPDTYVLDKTTFEVKTVQIGVRR